MASRDDIKFLSNPNLGQNRKSIADSVSMESNTLITKILISYCSLLMSKVKFCQGEFPVIH